MILIHSNFHTRQNPQRERDQVLYEFKSGRHPVMMATDVAARGLGTQQPAAVGKGRVTSG